MPLTQMQTAYDHFNEHRNTLKMTTGSVNLDSLIDSIQEGQFYLFYGSNKTFLDGLVHGLLVNCILPVREKHGFESMAMYINNVDYYQPDKSKVLSPEKNSNRCEMCKYRTEDCLQKSFRSDSL
jgi:hypothetical protein